MGIKVHLVQESHGKNVDRILEDLMGLETTRPNEVLYEGRSDSDAIQT